MTKTVISKNDGDVKKSFSIENAREAIFWADAETGLIINCNKAAETLLEKKKEEIVGHHQTTIHPPEKAEHYANMFKTHIEENGAIDRDVEVITASGKTKLIRVTTVVTSVEGRSVVQGIFHEIVEPKRLEKLLWESEARFRRLFETAKDGILILDAETGAITEVNPFLVDMLGYSREDFLGKKLWEIGFFKDIETSKVAFKELQAKKYIRYEDLPLETKDGRHVDVEFVSNVYWVDHQKVIQCNIRDISARKKLERVLKESEARFKYMSFHDHLTGLYNRAYFAEEMARLGSDLSRSAPISIISIDIDGLKLVNDTLGHKAGDQLLITASGIISTPFRKMDVIARIGGDEFCVVLPGADYQVALARKKEIGKSILAYNEKNPELPISISTGVATSQGGEGEHIYDIYQKADEAMYENKMLKTESPKSGTVDLLLSALSERDYIAQGHVDRLTKMAETAADKMNLLDTERRNLILLAKVHDLGKVGIPDKILFKPEKLSEDEYAIMKKHARIGYNIASRSKELFHIANLVLHHHEFWDGNGYGDSLKGEQIPLECRIFSIMDAYDAMTNMRPYHEGVSKEEAIEELRKCSGSQFEPGLVDQFVAFLE